MSESLGAGAAVRRRPGVVHRRLGDERAVLLNLDSAGYFGLNTVGSAVWDLLETPRTLPELVERLRSRCDDPPEGIDDDVAAFLAALHARGLVEVCDADGR
ncbi:MAG: PqqD family protein [Nitriliruptorales bacterium]